MAKTTKRAQITFEDRAKFIEDTELEGLLQERDELNEARLKAQHAYDEKDEVVQGRIAAYDFPPGDYRRCGEYILERKIVESKVVEEFTTKGGPRLTIKRITAEQKVASGED